MIHSLYDDINTDRVQHLLYTLPYDVRCSVFFTLVAAAVVVVVKKG